MFFFVRFFILSLELLHSILTIFISAQKVSRNNIYGCFIIYKGKVVESSETLSLSAEIAQNQTKQSENNFLVLRVNHNKT